MILISVLYQNASTSLILEASPQGLISSFLYNYEIQSWVDSKQNSSLVANLILDWQHWSTWQFCTPAMSACPSISDLFIFLLRTFPVFHDKMIVNILPQPMCTVMQCNVGVWGHSMTTWTWRGGRWSKKCQFKVKHVHVEVGGGQKRSK